MYSPTSIKLTANDESKQTCTCRGNFSCLIWPSFFEQTLCSLLWVACGKAVFNRSESKKSVGRHDCISSQTRQVSRWCFLVFNWNNRIFCYFEWNPDFWISFLAITRFSFFLHQITRVRKLKSNSEATASAVFEKFAQNPAVKKRTKWSALSQLEASNHALDYQKYPWLRKKARV